MKSRNPQQPTSEQLAALLEGEVTASQAAELHRDIAASRDTQQRFSQLQRIRDVLATPDPDIEKIDLVAGVRNALREGPSSVPKPRAWQLWLTLGAATACMGLAVMAGGASRHAPHSEFRAKSAATDDERHAAVHVYRPRAGRTPEPVEHELSITQGLVFSYINVGKSPYTYLMIFAVDASQEVRWFYPAYVEEGSDPMSQRIVAQASQALLPDIVEHDFAEGPMQIYALFTERPLRVSEVERWLQARAFRPSGAPVARAHLQQISLRVVP